MPLLIANVCYLEMHFIETFANDYLLIRDNISKPDLTALLCKQLNHIIPNSILQPIYVNKACIRIKAIRFDPLR